MRGTCGNRFSQLPFVLDSLNLVNSFLITFPPGVFLFVSKFLFFYRVVDFWNLVWTSDGTDIRIWGYPIKNSHPNPKNMQMKTCGFGNMVTYKLKLQKHAISYKIKKNPKPAGRYNIFLIWNNMFMKTLDKTASIVRTTYSHDLVNHLKMMVFPK